jgi:DNA-binding SARP family transcriptional activator/tetratricopeptide (TPR) repeat protein
VDFGLLGPLLVRDGPTQVPVPARRQRVLLAALLLSPGRVVSLDALAETLWDGRPPVGARGALHSTVQRLRSTLGPAGSGLVHTQAPGYLIEVGDGELDVRRFGSLVDQGQAAAAAGRWDQTAGLLRQALGLWRGEPLADVPSTLLRTREVPPLEERRLQALALRIDADLRLGRHGQLVPELRQLVTAHPLQEKFHAQLMLGLYRGGQPADALSAYQDVRRRLADELGVDPGPELRRLQQAILAGDPELLRPPDDRAGGPSVRAARPEREPQREPRPEPVVPRQLPPATRYFAGRAGELGQLAGLLAEEAEASAAVTIVTIDGTAGVGKSTLAVHFAHQVAERFRDGQLYVNLRGFDPAGPPMATAEAIRLFLDTLTSPDTTLPASLDAQAGLYRSLLAGKRMLLLLDNARDADQVRPLLPGSPGCLVIVTSRSQLISLVAAEGAYPVTLDVLTEAEARELLTERLGERRAASDPAAASELIRLCDHLPMALSIAAARAASQPEFPLAALAADLRDAGGRLDALDSGDTAASVRAVFSWSYHQLDAPSARVFRLLGLHPGTGIGAAAAASMAGLPQREARQALGELTRARLLAAAEPGRLAFHDLLRAYATERAEAEDSAADRREAVGRMLDHYLHTACGAAVILHPTRRPITPEAPRPGTAPEQFADAGQALAWFEAERPALLAVTAAAAEGGFDRHAWQLAWAVSLFLDLRGYWHDEVAAARIGIAAAERLGELEGLAEAHRTYGVACGHLGWHAEAYRHLEEALGRYVKMGSRVGEAYAHSALSITLGNEGREREALDHARQALELFTALDFPAGRASSLNHVGWSLVQLGDYDEALRYCHEALDLLAVLGNRQMEAATLDSIGYAHFHLGHHAEAVEYFQRSLAVNAKLGDRLGLAEVLSHVGDARRAAGDLAGARAAWEESLAVLAELHRSDAWQVRAKLSELGELGELDAGEPAADRAPAGTT